MKKAACLAAITLVALSTTAVAAQQPQPGSGYGDRPPDRSDHSGRSDGSGRADRPGGSDAGPPDYFSLGIAAAAGRPEFQDSDFIVNAFPFLGFRQGRFYSNQAGIGFALYDKNRFRLSIGAEVGVSEINRNDVDALDDMDRLDLPIYAGVSLDVPVDGFMLAGSIQREVGLAGDGWRAIGSISRAFTINRAITLAPSVSFQWLDDRTTNYLYGVGLREIVPGRSFYKTDDSIKATASITGVFRLNDKFTLIGSSGVTRHSDEIVASPIVDRRTIFSTFLALGYNF